MITVTATESEIFSAGKRQILMNGGIDTTREIYHEEKRNTKTGEIIHIWTQEEMRPRQ